MVAVGKEASDGPPRGTGRHKPSWEGTFLVGPRTSKAQHVSRALASTDNVYVFCMSMFYGLRGLVIVQKTSPSIITSSPDDADESCPYQATPSTGSTLYYYYYKQHLDKGLLNAQTSHQTKQSHLAMTGDDDPNPSIYGRITQPDQGQSPDTSLCLIVT